MSVVIPKEIETLKNEDFILRCFSLLKAEGKLDEHTLNCLSDGDWCMQMDFMQRAKPILKQIPLQTTEQEFRILRLDGTSQSRYYSHTLLVNNKRYMITNYWYGPQTNHRDNRTPFMNWVRQKLS